MEPYASLFPHASLVLRATDVVAERVMLLPTGTAVGPEEIAGICQIVRLAVTASGDVREAIEARRRADGPTPTKEERKVA
jgi:hypothetical protein